MVPVRELQPTLVAQSLFVVHATPVEHFGHDPGPEILTPQVPPPPEQTVAEAAAAGAVTLWMTGTDQTAPPTTAAFFMKSRREWAVEAPRAAVAGAGEGAAPGEVDVPVAARFAQRSSQPPTDTSSSTMSLAKP